MDGDDDVNDSGDEDDDGIDNHHRGDKKTMKTMMRTWEDCDCRNSDKAPNPEISLIAFWTCSQCPI